MKIDFNEVKHQYKINGIIVPSNTQILKGAGFIDFSGIPKEILDRACNFGTAVHLACEYEDEGRLDRVTLNDALIDPLIAWNNFIKEKKVEIIENEMKVGSEKYMYAGKLDRIARINGSERLTVIDIKTGARQGWHAYQLAGYEQAYRETTKTRQRLDRMTVYLKGKEYKLEEHKDKGDLNVFLAASIVCNAKQKIKDSIPFGVCV